MNAWNGMASLLMRVPTLMTTTTASRCYVWYVVLGVFICRQKRFAGENVRIQNSRCESTSWSSWLMLPHAWHTRIFDEKKNEWRYTSTVDTHAGTLANICVPLRIASDVWLKLRSTQLDVLKVNCVVGTRRLCVCVYLIFFLSFCQLICDATFIQFLAFSVSLSLSLLLSLRISWCTNLNLWTA